MSNIALEEEQVKTYNDVIAKYKFTAVGGGAPMEESPEMEALKPGIRLHFLRYGLFYKKSAEDVTASINKPTHVQEDGKKSYTINEVSAPNSQIPSLDNFYIARTSLKPGYIYLFNADDPEGPDCHEYEVQEDGSLSTILWRNNKDAQGRYLDIRKSEGDNFTYKVVSREKTFWFAYSPVQWTEKYLQDTRKDAAKTEARMQKVECRGINMGGDSHEHAIGYKDLYAVHYRNHPSQGALQTIVHTIDADEKRQDQEEDENELFEDMFVTLDDPIGCAADVSEVVSENTLVLKATIDAIQSGESIEEALTRLKSGDIEAKQPEKEYQELFTLALTCYQMVYNDDKAILEYDGGSPGWFNFDDRHSLDPRPLYSTVTSQGKYSTYTRQKKNSGYIGNGLDFQKLEGILGIQERKEARDKLITLRNDLGKLSKSDYLRPHLDDFLDNHPARVLDGRHLMLDVLDCLSYNPYDFDRHLMLEKEYKPQDQWVDWLYAITDDDCPESEKNQNVKSKAEGFEGMDPLYALLGASYNIERALGNTESFSKKIAGVYKKNLKYRAKQVAALKEINGTVYKTIPEKQQFIVDKLNRNLKVFGHEMFEIRDGDILTKLEEMGVELDPEYTKRGKYTGKRTDVLRILKESHPEGFEYERIRKGRYVDYNIGLRVRENLGTIDDLDGTTHRNIKISKIINGKAFNGLFAALELYNFGNAVVTVTSEGSIKKDGVYAIGSAIKLGEASMSLTKAIIISKGNSPSKLFAKNLTRLSVVGGAISAGWCFYDSYKSFDKGDMDAGLALVGAGVLFSVSALASLGTIAALGGPVGWITAAIGVGLLIIASLLTDSDLETYFKNFLLCDRVAFAKPAGTTPMAYIGQILNFDKRRELTHENYHDTLMNPLDAQAKLFDYIVCKEIAFSPKNENRSYTTTSTPVGPVFSTTSRASRFVAKMVFSRFFNHPKQVDAQVFLYPNGIKHGGGIPMDVGVPKKIYDTENEEALIINFSVPVAYLSKVSSVSDVVFALRLQVDASQNLYFPYPHGDNSDRYLGAKIKLVDFGGGIFVSNLHQNEDVVIAPLNQLKSRAAW